MFIVFIRTTILYFLVVLVMRLMGKRQIGELQPYEFVITIMISDLASLPMQDTRLPLILGIIPIITLLFIKTLLSQLQLKSQTARKILEGEPTILICRGKINYNALKKQQINLDELMEEIRLAGYFDLDEIEFGILENNGQLSFLTKQSASQNSGGQSQSQSGNSKVENPQINSELQSNSSQNQQQNQQQSKQKQQCPPRLPVIYVLDGKVNKNSLTSSNKNKFGVLHELKKHKIDSLDDLVFAMTDTKGKFVYQKRDDYPKEGKK